MFYGTMTTMTAPDLAALPGALARDLDRAFPDLVTALQDGIYSGCLRMLGNAHDAEEVTQEAFLRAYRALGGYPSHRIDSLQVRGWMWTIAANLCRNRLRTRARKPESPLADREFANPGAGPEDEALASLGTVDLAAHLLDLPFPMRAAVVLHHVVGLPYSEIAEALERPSGTVRSDAHRGLDRLRTTLAKEAS